MSLTQHAFQFVLSIPRTMCWSRLLLNSNLESSRHVLIDVSDFYCIHQWSSYVHTIGMQDYRLLESLCTSLTDSQSTNIVQVFTQNIRAYIFVCCHTTGVSNAEKWKYKHGKNPFQQNRNPSQFKMAAARPFDN